MEFYATKLPSLTSQWSPLRQSSPIRGCACSTDYGNAQHEWRDCRGVAYLGWICRRSGSGSVVVVQQSAETLPSFHFLALADECWIRADQLVLEALMVAFAVVMHDEFGRCATN